MVCVSAESSSSPLWRTGSSSSRNNTSRRRPPNGNSSEVRGGTNRLFRRDGRDHVRLLTGNIAAIHEDTVEVLSDKRMRVPRRGGGGRRQQRATGQRGPDHSGKGGGSSCCNGIAAGEVLDIEDLLGGAGAGDGDYREGQGEGEGGGDETVMFRIDKDEWAAGIK